MHKSRENNADTEFEDASDMFPVFQRALALEEEEEGDIMDRMKTQIATSALSFKHRVSQVLQKVSSNKSVAKRKKMKREGMMDNRKRKNTADAVIMKFIKAARFVRSSSQIHPSARLRLHGLYMQSQNGDCTVDAEGLGEANHDTVSVVVAMKHKAWESCKGGSGCFLCARPANEREWEISLSLSLISSDSRPPCVLILSSDANLQV